MPTAPITAADRGRWTTRNRRRPRVPHSPDPEPLHPRVRRDAAGVKRAFGYHSRRERRSSGWHRQGGGRFAQGCGLSRRWPARQPRAHLAVALGAGTADVNSLNCPVQDYQVSRMVISKRPTVSVRRRLAGRLGQVDLVTVTHSRVPQNFSSSSRFTHTTALSLPAPGQTVSKR